VSGLPGIAAGGRGRTIASVALLALGQAGCAGIAAFATRDIFVALGEGGAAPSAALIALVLGGLGLALLRVAERILAERLGQDYAGALRLTLFRHISRLPQRAVAERRAGALTLRFVGDLQAVRGWVAKGLARMISAAIVIPLTTIVLFLLEPVLGAAAALPLALGLLAMVLAGRTLAPAHRRLRNRRARLAADLSERLPHGPELRLLGRLETECRRLVQRTEALIEAAVARAQRSALLRAIPDIAATLAGAGLLAAAWWTGATPATAAGSLAALGLLTHPLRTVADGWELHRGWLIARDKCEAVLRTPPMRRAVAKADTEDAPPGQLAFRQVRLDRGKAGFDAVARAGEKVAVVGPNGSGKSLLLAVAAGLEQPACGEVMLGGTDIRTFGRRERQQRIAFAGPHSPILKGSLRRSLSMGCAHVPDDPTICRQATAAGLGLLLERLGGLDGTVAEGGRNLSSGEVRRILWTRALLSGADLVLLDEPDDALDPAGSEELWRALSDQPATTLVVTHNRALARRMDTIWLVEDGSVVASGPASDLCRSDGPIAGFFHQHHAA
jgi:ABC-type multidrug transport system fused ATPase/permease subunit